MPEGGGEVLNDGPHSYEEPALGSVHTQALGGRSREVGRGAGRRGYCSVVKKEEGTK